MIARLLTSAGIFVLLFGPAFAAEEEAHEEAFFDLANPEFWVAVSFVLFFVVLFKPIRKTLTSKLDGRAEVFERERSTSTYAFRVRRSPRARLREAIGCMIPTADCELIHSPAKRTRARLRIFRAP